MRRAGKTLIICGLGSFLACGGAAVIASTASTPGPDQNPYEGIVQRNLFALKAPAPPPKPPPPKVDVPKITLTGITDILGKKQALLLVDERGKPPHNKAQQKSYILVEGQRDGDIEVLHIDKDAGTVKVNNHGTIQTLNFEDNGVKLPKASALAAAHPQPQRPGFRLPGQRFPGGRHIPMRTMRFGSPSQSRTVAGNPSASGGTMVPGFAPGQGRVNMNSQPRLTVGQQEILIEAQRAKALDQGSPMAKLLPPTEFTKKLVPQ